MRWMASAFLRTEKRFNKIMGHRDLWALEAILNPAQPASRRSLRSNDQPNRRLPLSTTRGTCSRRFPRMNLQMTIWYAYQIVICKEDARKL